MECCAHPFLFKERRKTMTKVLITLTPAGRFFFGGDNTFEVERNGKVLNSEFSSYIVNSNLFPQQTSLLGMLRYQILSKSNAFDANQKTIINKVDAEEYIGKSSFSVGNENSFGFIKSIGPCILQRKKTNSENDWENIFIAPKDYTYEVNFENSFSGVFNKMDLCVPTVLEKKNEEMVPYDPKDAPSLLLLSQNGILIPSEDVFVEDSRIGIYKDYTGVAKDSAFFKQIAYKFNDKQSEYEYRFAFSAEIENDISTNKGEIVSVGGDNSKFIINKEVFLEFDFSKFRKNNISYKRVVLTSNSFVNNNISFDFSIADTIPFRFLETTIHTNDYNIISQAAKRSKKYELYQSGSVFYFKDDVNLEAFTKELDSHNDFIQIGYNQYQIFKN